MFYLSWFGQFTFVMVLAGTVALLVPPPAISGLALIAVIAWGSRLLGSLARHLYTAQTPEPRYSDAGAPAGFGLGAQVAVTPGASVPAQTASRPAVPQRVQAAIAAAGKRTCRRIGARLPRDSRGRSFPPSYIYCRARRRLPAA